MNTMHPAIHELKKRLLDRYGGRLVRFIVHGSYARGEHTPDSDIDIMISLTGDVNSQTEIDIWNVALEVDIRYDVVFDVQVYSEEDILHTIIGATPYVETVLKEGVTV